MIRASADDSCTESYSELSQTTEINLLRNQLTVFSINCFRKSTIADA